MDTTRLSELTEKQLPLTGTQVQNAVQKAHDISSSASEIDGSVNNRVGIRKVFDKSSNLNLFGKAITILGDSHTVGVGSSTAFLTYKEILRNKLANIYTNFNFGIDTGLGYQYSTLQNVTWYRNENAQDCLTGFYFELVNTYDASFLESSSYTPIEMTNKKVRFLCPLSEVGKTFEVYGWTGSESATATLTVGSDGLTNEYSIGNYNWIRIRNITETPIRIETYYIYDDASYYGLFNFASSGRALVQVDNSQINRWFNNAEVAIFALGTNDSYSSSFQAKLDYIESLYKSQKFTKLIVLDLDIVSSRNNEKRLAIKKLSENCEGSTYISISQYISTIEATKEELYQLGIVKSDLTHFNDNGHEIIANLIFNALV